MKLHFTVFRPANKLHQSVRAGKVLSCLVVLLRLLGRASNYFTQCLNQSSLPGRRFMLSGAGPARRSCAAGGRAGRNNQTAMLAAMGWCYHWYYGFFEILGFRSDRSKA